MPASVRSIYGAKAECLCTRIDSAASALPCTGYLFSRPHNNLTKQHRENKPSRVFLLHLFTAKRFLSSCQYFTSAWQRGSPDTSYTSHLLILTQATLKTPQHLLNGPDFVTPRFHMSLPRRKRDDLLVCLHSGPDVTYQKSLTFA